MKRQYNQNCALAEALDVVGERWTLLIVRELLLGPRRYGELLENLVGIGTNLLSERLKDMQNAGLVEKTGPRYRLTPLGSSLEPAIHALVRFGLNLGLSDDPQRVTRPEWDAVALKALYRDDRDQGLDGRYVVELDGHPVGIEASGSGVRVVPGELDAPRLRLRMTKRTARRLAGGAVTLEHALSTGEVELEGGRKDARVLLRAFSILG